MPAVKWPAASRGFEFNITVILWYRHTVASPLTQMSQLIIFMLLSFRSLQQAFWCGLLFWSNRVVSIYTLKVLCSSFLWSIHLFLSSTICDDVGQKQTWQEEDVCAISGLQDSSTHRIIYWFYARGKKKSFFLIQQFPTLCIFSFYLFKKHIFIDFCNI